jgi:hypothetical protein
MGVPDFMVFIKSRATIEDVAAFLGLDLSETEAVGDGAWRHRLRRGVGPMTLFYGIAADSKEPDFGLEFGDYPSGWNLCVTFETPARWHNIGLLLALELAADLHIRFGGTYLGAYDTGSVMFFLKEGKLVLNETERDYFSRFPVPFDDNAIEFASLPPV